MLTWKIMGVSEVSVIYIYRLIHRNKIFLKKKKTMEFILKNYQKLE